MINPKPTADEAAADAYAAISEGRYKDGTPVAHELVDAFLAGCAHARQAVRIDPKDESTWPPDSDHLAWFTFSDLEVESNWEHCSKRLSSGFYEGMPKKIRPKNISIEKQWLQAVITVTYWAPLPTLPTEEQPK